MALLGFYGGTFDPIHHGHLQLALYVAAHCQLSCLQLLPCHLPPHRAHPGVSSAHRAAMVELAIAPYPQLQLNTLELSKNSPSYTVETLEQLRAQYPTDTLLFVIGMDSLNQFQHWHRYQDILATVPSGGLPTTWLQRNRSCHRQFITALSSRRYGAIATTTLRRHAVTAKSAVRYFSQSNPPNAATAVKSSTARTTNCRGQQLYPPAWLVSGITAVKKLVKCAVLALSQWGNPCKLSN